jgi:hypothetical protein
MLISNQRWLLFCYLLFLIRELDRTNWQRLFEVTFNKKKKKKVI